MNSCSGRTRDDLDDLAAREEAEHAAELRAAWVHEQEAIAADVARDEAHFRAYLAEGAAACAAGVLDAPPTLDRIALRAWHEGWRRFEDSQDTTGLAGLEARRKLRQERNDKGG